MGRPISSTLTKRQRALARRFRRDLGINQEIATGVVRTLAKMDSERMNARYKARKREAVAKKETATS